MKTIFGIQYLRGLAALAVVLIHANNTMGDRIYYSQKLFEFEAAAGLAVQMFFCISGFIMAVICLDKDGLPKLSRREFFIRRFVRIVPFMWFCTVAYNLFTLAGTGEVNWPSALRALILWPEGTLKPNVLWTLRLEMIFYIIITFCLLGRRRHPWILVVWCVMPLLVRTLGVAYPEILSDGTNDDLVWVTLMGHQAGANVQFGIGLLIGIAWQKNWVAPSFQIKGGLAVLIVFFVVASLLLQSFIADDPRGFTYVLMSSWLATIGLFIAIWVKPLKGWIGWIALELGESSYAIYLIHYIPLFTMFEISRRASVPGPQWLHYVLIVAVSVVFGCFIHHQVETKIIAFCRRLIERPAQKIIT